MNQTGVASTACSRQASMERDATAAAVRLEHGTAKAHEILERRRLEPKLRPELAQLVRNSIVEEVVGGDAGDGRVALICVGAQAAEETEAVDERHPEVEND